MPVGPDTFPTMRPVPGIRLGVISAGIKAPGRQDLVVFEVAPGSSTAAVFTRNAFCAAPVQVARAHLVETSPRYLVINTGNANAGTGDAGLEDARRTCAVLAEAAGVSEQAVLPFSTGVIGEPLPTDRIVAAIPLALAALDENAWRSAAAGIMTTDTRPKGSSRQVTIDGQRITVTGIAKGAGMIRPDMATMLAFVATDAAVEQGIVECLLREAVETSFNRITVDGDTSTNDACVLVATGKAGVPAVSDVHDARYAVLAEALTGVFVELAQAIIRDAEGATKFVTVNVCGGASEAECLKVAYAVAESPLVKTALFASDPNWGRLLAAIGRAGVEKLDVEGVTVYLNGILLAERGARAAGYREEDGVAAMAENDIEIRIDLGRGEARETVWTSDLSHEYVRINAEYRT